MTPPTSTPDLTDNLKRIDYMRKRLRPYWANDETGGVILITGADRTVYREFLKEFYHLPGAAEAPTDDMRIEFVTNMLTEDVKLFFRVWKLRPGRYELENYHRYGEDCQGGDIGEEIPYLPMERKFVFEVTHEHLKLKRHMNIQAWLGYIEVIDAKRPYGDNSSWYVMPFDMCYALGEGPRTEYRDPDDKLTDEQRERYRRLHSEMLYAIQAYWEYAQIILPEERP